MKRLVLTLTLLLGVLIGIPNRPVQAAALAQPFVAGGY
jgi:hypothetical protein